MESKLTTAELRKLIHMRSRRRKPLVANVCPVWDIVFYTVGSRRYVANRSLRVMEVSADDVFASPDADYQQGLLRGGKRDEAGTLIAEESNAAS